VIVTKIKPLDEILMYLEPYKKILVLGCDGCTQPPRSLKEAEIYAEFIELEGKLNKRGYECKTFTVSRQCDNKILERNLPPELEGIDAVLSMACGIGPQTIAEVFPELRVLPAQNTLFMGSEKMEEAALFEKCRGCGDCVLYASDNICPITRCSKNILNGPCGGTTADGKCEVDPNTDCAWYLIYNRKSADGKLPAIFDQINPPRDWRPAGHGGPRKSTREELVMPVDEEKPSEEVKE